IRKTIADLGRAIDARGPALVVLDNVEHFAAAAAPAIAQLLVEAPALRILATSRERLRLSEESVLELCPLPVPEPHEGAPERFAAVTLFLDRARRVAPGWAEAPEDAAHVAAIVRRLDGFPLAIELGAMRARVLGPAALRARIDGDLGTIGAGPRDAAERHRTLARVIDWSMALLSPVERRAFEQCAVFAGGFSLEAAEA